MNAKLGPSWIQVAPSWYQDRTKRAHKQIIHTFTAPPKGPQPANMAGLSNKEATKEQQGSNKDGPGVDLGHIFGIFSERFRLIESLQHHFDYDGLVSWKYTFSQWILMIF